MQDTLNLPLPSQRVDRIDSLQMLRMVAVMLVAWMHAGQPLAVSGYRLPDLGMFGVDIFFVISGFILSLIVLRGNQSGIGPASEFMRRRIVRIFPIYWTLAAYPFLHHAWHREEVSYLPALFLLPGLRYPDLPVLVNFSWTLIFEMFFYLSFAGVLLFFARREAIRTIIVVLCAMVELGMLINIQHPILIIALNPILLEFVAGAMIALIYSRSPRRPIAGAAVLGIGFALAFFFKATEGLTFEYAVLTNQQVLLRSATWGLSAALIVLGGVLWCPSMDSAAGQLAVLLGNASYSTYLLSGFLFQFLAHEFFRLGHHIHGYVLLLSAQVFITSLMMGAGLAFYLWVEKPLLRLANLAIPPVFSEAPRKKRYLSDPVW
jgi:exopolysaccharide production protein ExoZ